MNKAGKKEIREAVERAIDLVLLKFKVSSPSRKTKKVLNSLSKKIIQEVKKKGVIPKKRVVRVKKVSVKRVKKSK
jgi:hypothetical protein